MYPFLVKVLGLIFDAIHIGMLAYVVLCWIPHPRYKQPFMFIDEYVGRLFKPFRGILVFRGVDFSMILAFLVFYIVKGLSFAILKWIFQFSSLFEF